MTEVASWSELEIESTTVQEAAAAPMELNFEEGQGKWINSFAQRTKLIKYIFTFVNYFHKNDN